MLNSLFAKTRDIAASPLKASQAYKNIVDGLQAAKVTALAAKEIVEDVHKKVKHDYYNTIFFEFRIFIFFLFIKLICLNAVTLFPFFI